MKHLSQTTKFTRDIKRMRKRGKDLSLLQRVVKMLVQDLTLPQKFKDHALIGVWQSSRDCHIEPDWLLIYTSDESSLRLERTGSHSDLFK